MPVPGFLKATKSMMVLLLVFFIYFLLLMISISVYDLTVVVVLRYCSSNQNTESENKSS